MIGDPVGLVLSRGRLDGEGRAGLFHIANGRLPMLSNTGLLFRDGVTEPTGLELFEFVVHAAVVYNKVKTVSQPWLHLEHRFDYSGEW